jgi:hypothetical protein
MEKLVQQNPLASPSTSSNPSGTGGTNPLSTPLSPLLTTSPMNSSPSRTRNCPSPRLSETSEVIVYPSSISLRVCINKKSFEEKKNPFFFFFFLPHINDKV